MLEILNITFKPALIQKSSRIKVYKALAVPILLHGSEIWTLRQKDKKRLTSGELIFFRRKAEHTLLTTKGMKKFWKS
jgi:hypothetical protein